MLILESGEQWVSSASSRLSKRHEALAEFAPWVLFYVH